MIAHTQRSLENRGEIATSSAESDTSLMVQMVDLSGNQRSLGTRFLTWDNAKRGQKRITICRMKDQHRPTLHSCEAPKKFGSNTETSSSVEGATVAGGVYQLGNPTSCLRLKLRRPLLEHLF